MDRYQVFISYKRDIDESHIEGSSIAANLYVELEKAGFHTFFDKEEMGLNSYKENIEAAILSSDVFVLVVSPNVFSENVEWEIDKAQTDEHRIIIPVGRDRTVLEVLDKINNLKDLERFSLEDYSASSNDISYSSLVNSIINRLSKLGVEPVVGEKETQRKEAENYIKTFRETAQAILLECKNCKRYQEKACPFIHNVPPALVSPPAWAEGPEFDVYRHDYYKYEEQQECAKLENKFGRGHLFKDDASLSFDFHGDSIDGPCRAQRENIEKFKKINPEPLHNLSYARLKELIGFCDDLVARFSSEATEYKIADSVICLLQAHKMLAKHRLAEVITNRVFIEKSFKSQSFIDNLKRVDDYLALFLSEKRTKIELAEHQLLYELWWRTRPESLDLTVLEINEQMKERGELFALIDSFLSHFQELSRRALHIVLEYPSYASPQTLDLDEREWFVYYKNPEIEREKQYMDESDFPYTSFDYNELEEKEMWMPFLDFRWHLSDLVWLDDDINESILFDEANNPHFKDNKIQYPPYLIRAAFDDERSLSNERQDSYDYRLSDALRDYARGYSLGSLVDHMKELKSLVATVTESTTIDKRLSTIRNNALKWFNSYADLDANGRTNDRESEVYGSIEPSNWHSTLLFHDKVYPHRQRSNTEYEHAYALYSQEGISSIRARSFFKKAAEEGVLEACVFLGNMLSQTEDVTEQIQAIRWYEKAFSGGCKLVARSLIYAYQKVGEYEKALLISRFCHNAYLQPTITSSCWIPPCYVSSKENYSFDVNQGDLYFYTGDIKSAIDTYLRQGTTYDIFRLLNCISWQEWEDATYKRNLVGVFELHFDISENRAKEIADTLAQEIYEEVCPADLSPSRVLTSRDKADLPALVEIGDAEAQFNMAMLLLEEMLSEQQFHSVLNWLDLAAKNGYPKAFFILIALYIKTEKYGYSPEVLFSVNPRLSSEGIAKVYNMILREIGEKSSPEDFHLGDNLSSQEKSQIRKLAQQGDMDAQYKIAMLNLERMIKGPRFQTIIGWLDKAAGNGHRKAKSFLTSFYEKTGEEKEHRSDIHRYYVACIRHRFSELFPGNSLNEFTIPDRIILSDE